MCLSVVDVISDHLLLCVFSVFSSNLDFLKQENLSFRSNYVKKRWIIVTQSKKLTSVEENVHNWKFAINELLVIIKHFVLVK